jgi:hypothetical protein
VAPERPGFVAPGRRGFVVAARLGLVSLLVALGCATGNRRLQPEELAGCYYFQRDTVAESLRLPWGVRLRDVALEGWPAQADREGAREATTLTGRSEVDHPFGYWAPLPGDSIEVGYPAGGGLLLQLGVVDHDLAGTARPVGDVLQPGQEPGPRPSRNVRLVWARCPEP